MWIIGKKGNNNFSNLEWVDNKTNVKHSFNIGTSKPTNYKPVIKCDLEGKELERYLSISDAKRSLKSKGCDVNAVCQGRQEMAGGYKWKFA